MNQYLGWIPPHAHKILEFGCNNGELGKIFKEVQPQCFYVGVDMDVSILKQASLYLDLTVDGHDKEKIAKIIEDLSPWDCVIYRSNDYFRFQPMDIAISDKGQILIHNGTNYYEFPWRMAKRIFNSPIQMISLFQDPVCAFMRMIIPNGMYKTDPDINVMEMELGKLWDDDALRLGGPYLLLFQRVLSRSIESAINLQERLSSYGALMIHEFDDWPERWGAEYKEARYMDFVGSHVIQTTTPALADYFRQYNPYVLTFPNELCNLPPRKEHQWDEKHINIFYGAVNREEDWQEIMPILNEAVVRYGDKIRFLVVADKLFYNQLQTPHKEFIGENINGGRFVPYDLYENTLHAADIALLPLKDTAFNRMKSDLKFIEAAGHGVAALAANTVYENSIIAGETGLLYSSVQEFRQNLFMLIEKKELRYKIIDNAYEYVKNNRLMCQHYENRIEIYKELLNKREELEKERQHRVCTWVRE